MTRISAALVKQLREKTGSGMMDCKRALAETDGDLEAAQDWLRAKGIAGAEKKAGRAAAEGLVGIRVDGNRAALVEVNAETDFVARNAEFQEFVREVAEAGLDAGGDVDVLAASRLGGGATVAERAIEVSARTGENIVVRRTESVAIERGLIGSYMHGSVVPGLGRIGTLVAVETDGQPAGLEECVKQLAMHVAAARPRAIRRDDLDPALIERERAVLLEQARESDRPDNIIEKMVDGRMRKFYGEVVLTEQVWVIDNKTKVSDALASAAKEVGVGAELSGLACLVLGEGVEKRVSNLADEVAGTLKS
ncbi:MAG: translation elongation factor Ts [Rhodospirillales bacterium]|nr:translation elongation factor Ts [Rhodospirillales bacterium]